MQTSVVGCRTVFYFTFRLMLLLNRECLPVTTQVLLRRAVETTREVAASHVWLQDTMQMDGLVQKTFAQRTGEMLIIASPHEPGRGGAK